MTMLRVRGSEVVQDVRTIPLLLWNGALGELVVSVGPGDTMVSNRLAGHVECQLGIEFC